MSAQSSSRGFTLVELLLVLAILGVISAIAIPNFLGQRRRARVIGDAMTNCRILQMGLDAYKAESGVYGVAGTTYDWKADGSATSGPALIPSFQPKGSTSMNYGVAVANQGLTYILTVTDPVTGPGVPVYQTNQNGEELARLH